MAVSTRCPVRPTSQLIRDECVNPRQDLMAKIGRRHGHAEVLAKDLGDLCHEVAQNVVEIRVRRGFLGGRVHWLPTVHGRSEAVAHRAVEGFSPQRRQPRLRPCCRIVTRAPAVPAVAGGCPHLWRTCHGGRTPCQVATRRGTDHRCCRRTSDRRRPRCRC